MANKLSDEILCDQVFFNIRIKFSIVIVRASLKKQIFLANL